MAQGYKSFELSEKTFTVLNSKRLPKARKRGSYGVQVERPLLHQFDRQSLS